MDEHKPAATAVYDGTTYYFCAPGCKRTFEANPHNVLQQGPKGMGSAGAAPIQMMTLAPKQPKPDGPASSSPNALSSVDLATLTIPIEGMSCASCVAKIERGLAAVPGVKNASVNLATEKATVEYRPAVTSPAHIEEAIRGLGYTPLASIPKTGKLSSAEERQRTAYRKLQVRFWVAAVLSVPVMILGMADHLGLHISPSLSAWLQLLLTTPIQFWAGWQFYRGAFAVARHGSADMNTLIALGTTAAYGYSVMATVVPGAFAPQGTVPPVYFDSAAAIVTLILLGRLLEARAKSRTSEAITRLLGLQPKQARVIRASLAAAAMGLSSVSVVSNALRLRFFKNTT